MTTPDERVQDPGSRLAEALAALDTVRDAPPAEQVVPLAEAQRVLRETLDSVEDA
jgi:hypothetical protein